MAGLASLASRVGSFLSEKRTFAYLIELDRNTDVSTRVSAFQYFPESLTDSKAVSWQAKEIPGGSLPLYQWTGSGERTISFTAQFSTDIDPFATDPQWTVAEAEALKSRLKDNGALRRNVDIRSAVAWLRQYMLPQYKTSGTNQQTLPPPKLVLFLPNSGIGIAGGYTSATLSNAVVCVMTQCEVTWDKFFPSGYPRLASVSLAFAQVPQYKGAVEFPQAEETMAGLTKGGGDYNGTTYLGYSTFFEGNANQLFKITQ